LAELRVTKHCEIELVREERQVANSPKLEVEEVYRLFAEYGLGRDVVRPLAKQLRGDPDA
jgi:hypothetical protein